MSDTTEPTPIPVDPVRTSYRHFSDKELCEFDPVTPLERELMLRLMRRLGTHD